MGAEPGEENVRLFVAQEVLESEDGGEIRDHDREHNGGRRERRATRLPAREVFRHRSQRDGRVCED